MDAADRFIAAQMKKRKKKTRKWLGTPAGQAWLGSKINEKDAAKSEQRKRRDMAEMKRRGLHVDCSKCLHEIGHHCLLHLPDGCMDYLEVHTLRRLEG